MKRRCLDLLLVYLEEWIEAPQEIAPPAMANIMHIVMQARNILNAQILPRPIHFEDQGQ